MSAPVAVVIPARHEASRLPLLLADLGRAPQLLATVIVVDGGSGDGTVVAARLAGAQVLHAQPNRGAQLVQGISASTAPWLWLLHADVRLPADWPARVAAVVESSTVPQPLEAWYGDLRVDLPGLPYRVLEQLVGLRSRWRQRPYGDQGLLLHRCCYDACGGLRPLPLMEDLDFAERFASQGRFCRLRLPLQVDGRRWRRLGVLGTAWANAALRRAWRRGVAPQTLAQRYRG
ncbi:MAG: glycosyltransferase [Cyanobacteria bacterium K_DeepCast_35m_m2_023]|nr:glycosyltransferase [Cyanobacteria bacterium K_DeepCast_35m_m2_023]